ncbi:MAG: outer membrane beta-barrel domain-containing protein [Deltaproteobacteria bacterium]
MRPSKDSEKRRRGTWPMAAAWFVCAVALAAAGARADEGDEVEDSGNTAAVQNREYRMGQEIELAATLLPYDAFYKGVAPTASYTFHFSDTFAWEVFRVGYSVDFDTGLKQQLLQLGSQPTQFNETQLFVTSNVLYSPLYLKGSLANRSVVHGELYLLLGGGAFQETDGFHPAPDGGLGVRVFLSHAFSVRVELRDAVIFDSKFTNSLDANVGLAFNFLAPG